MAELGPCTPVIKKVNFLFYGMFGQLANKPLKSGVPNRLENWTAFAPEQNHSVSPATTLPRLCVRCRGSKAATKLPDPFAQRSSSGCVWFRYNAGENRGEICIPSLISDASKSNLQGEVYRCQLCCNIMITKCNRNGSTMKVIFQEVLKEVEKLYYDENEKRRRLPPSRIPVKIEPKIKMISVMPPKQNFIKPKKIGWVLLIGNVMNSIHSPILIQSLFAKSGNHNSVGKTELIISFVIILGAN